MSSLSANPSHESRLTAALENLCEQVEILAKGQEAGQAQTPLSSSFERLQKPLHAEPVRAVLLGFTPEDTAAAVSALVGDDYNICRIIVPSRIGYTEVLLQERGFSVETGDQRLDFDQMEPFIEALEKEDLLQEGNPASWMDPLRLQLPAPSRRRGLRLFVPESLDALVRKPALLSTLADQADWLFLCGERDREIDSIAKDVLQVLIDQMVGLQCLIGGDGAELLPPRGWWTGWRVVCGLSPLQLDKGAVEVDDRLGLLTLPDSELRRFIQETRRESEVEANMELLVSEVDQTRQHLVNQRKLQRSGLIAGSGQDPEMRRIIDRAKDRFQEDLDAIRKSLEAESKRQLVPGGAAYEDVEKAACEIGVRDLLQDSSSAVIKLTLDEDCRQDLAAKVQRVVRARLTWDLGLIQETIDVAAEQLRETLKKEGGMAFRPSLPAFDEQQIWKSMLGLASPEIRYRGEMPKPTLRSRLGKARQGIFGILMLGMVLGAIGTLLGEQNIIRTYLYAAMLPLMIIGFFFTYISFRKQQETLLGKELEKLREGAGRELRRMAADLYREEQNVVGQQLQKLQRSLGNELGEQAQKLEAQKQNELEKSVKLAKEQERSIEHRLKQVEERRRKVGELSGSLPKLREGLLAWLEDWVKRFNKRTS